MSLERAGHRFPDDAKGFDVVEDLEKSLKFAEELQEKIIEADSRALSFRVWEVIAFVLGLVLNLLPLWIVPASEPSYARYFYLGHAIVLVVFLAVASYAEWNVRRIKRRVEHDKKGLEDLVDLMHETESAVVNSRELSTLGREYLRFRLSRFSLGAKAWKQ